MITPQRQAHMLQVGRTAERLARELFDWPDQKCRQMFLLGLLHDVGYEYAAEQPDHPRVGSELLEAAGYRYWQEVRWHGMSDAPYASDELLVLNVADVLTDAAGNIVSLSERLGDIGRRYGAGSPQLAEMSALADEVSARIAPLLHKSEWLRGLWR